MLCPTNKARTLTGSRAKKKCFLHQQVCNIWVRIFNLNYFRSSLAIANLLKTSVTIYKQTIDKLHKNLTFYQ